MKPKLDMEDSLDARRGGRQKVLIERTRKTILVLPREWIDERRRWGCGKPKDVGQVMRQGQEPSLQVRRSQVVVMCVANRWLVDTCVMGVTVASNEFVCSALRLWGGE